MTYIEPPEWWRAPMNTDFVDSGPETVDWLGMVPPDVLAAHDVEVRAQQREADAALVQMLQPQGMEPYRPIDLAAAIRGGTEEQEGGIVIENVDTEARRFIPWSEARGGGTQGEKQ